MSLAEDTILENRYRIDGLLIRGGMGAIYRAFDTNLNIPVAIKESYFQTPERIAQFKQEALILARLRHPGLPRVIHYFSTGGRQSPKRKQYLVMDFIDGENLWEIMLRTQKPLPESEALNYIIQICAAVVYLHTQIPPIIHRDIKPQNIKITPEGQAVLVDFGIAKELTNADDSTLAGARGVTPGFSPPEQYSGAGTTPASDIYSLGATLYALLTGQKPPDSVTLMAGGSKFKPPDKINKDLSHRVSEAIAHAMQVDPANRPPSVAAWQKELEAIAGASTGPDSNQDSTVVPLADSRQDAEETWGAAAPPAATYWLVDATGQGYPLGNKPLVIGRHSTADIVVEELSVSRNHAQIRIEGGRCQVLDNDSAGGTFINGRPLSQAWHPLSPGELLTVGATRFYLTATQPARLAPSKPKTASPVGAEPTAPLPPPDSSAGPAPAKPKRSRVSIGLVFILLLGVVGLVGYGLANPTLFSGLISFAPTLEDTPVQKTQPAAAGDTAAMPERTPTPVSLVDASMPDSAVTEQKPVSVVASPQVGTTAERLTLSTATASPTGSPAAATSSPSVTLSPTGTPTRAGSVATGPTLVPLQAEETIPRIGAREVTDVDINSKNPAEVYALVKGGGIYKSSTGGEGPWAKMKVDGSSIVAFVIDPTNPARFYAPTWNAVLKSTDGGNSWEAKMNGLVANRTVDLLVVNPANPNILYAGIGENLVVSTDGGQTWTSRGYGEGLGLARLTALVIDPFDPDVIYVGGLAASIYKSGDGGRTFIQLPSNTGLGSFGLAAHPAQKDIYLAGINASEAGIIKTENGFEFRSTSTGLIYGGADSAYSAITYAPSNPNIVYTGSGYESNPDAKGIFKSVDGGETWVRINRGLSINPDTGYPYYVKAMAVHPIKADLVLAATGGGLFKSVDGGANWNLQ